GDAKAKEYAHTTQVAMETCSTENSTGSYTGCDLTALRAIEPTIPTTGVEATVGTPTKGYTITTTGSAGKFSIVRSESGAISFTCNEKGKGGCPSSGNWGE
ncbi:MAG TPA: hypothetical protein VII45_09915, partial [Solirubrobacterales bacterium]